MVCLRQSVSDSRLRRVLNSAVPDLQPITYLVLFELLILLIISQQFITTEGTGVSLNKKGRLASVPQEMSPLRQC